MYVGSIRVKRNENTKAGVHVSYTVAHLCHFNCVMKLKLNNVRLVLVYCIKCESGFTAKYNHTQYNIVKLGLCI